METKYILHGGSIPGKEDEKEYGVFFKEILKDCPEKPKILLVFFAKDEDRIPKTRDKVKREFNRNGSGKELLFDTANKESFLEQIKWANIILLSGGISLKLFNTLKEFPPLDKLFEGKTIAGESAGANVLGKMFYSPNANKISKGLGIIPLKIIPHYSEKYKNVFEGVKPEIDNLYLKEYEYKVFKI